MKRLLIAAAAMTMFGPSFASDSSEKAAPASAQLPSVAVIGSKEEAASLPGSAAYLDRGDITQQGYDDIHRLLREIPGVYVREEDGYGLFPNISLRGADPGRSSKVTLMEDGILMAPAPYADPAAYYSPTAGRMAGIEVLKGSSQVRFGPHTTGGVINYLSTPIPLNREGYLRSAYGSNNEFRNQIWLGNTQQTEIGSFGYLVELYHRQTDGFKDIRGTVTDVGPSAGNSGFTRIEPMIKLAWTPNSAIPQRIEFKHGYSETDADETYLGLSRADFNANPHQRYSATQFDNIETSQQRTHLRYYVSPSVDTDLVATAYNNEFERNWFKIFGVNDGSGNVSLGRALADPALSNALAVLRGEAAGTLRYRNNNREYYSRGAEITLNQRYNLGEVRNTLRAGVRMHRDESSRFQNDVAFAQDANGTITGSTVGAPGSQDNRFQRAEALAVFAENTFDFGRLTVTPGVRFERVDWTTFNRNSGVSAEGDASFTTGGVGFNFTLSDTTRLFGGLYQGFSPPAPGDGISGADEEKSLSLELGARHRSGAGLTQELVLFGTRFDNLIVSDNFGASGSGAGDTEAVGKVDTYGVEYALRYDLGAARGWHFGVPLALAATWTRAEIANDSTGTGTGGGNVESIFSGGRKGARLPYVPDWQINASAGLRQGIWSIDARMIYVDSTFGTALNTEDELILASVDPVTGAQTLIPDARGGKTDSFTVFDVTGRVALTPDFSLFANVFNLLDREYLASRLPEGPRPGTPRTLLIGFEASLF
jgi:Fe(3+) dicitrate transport protein